MELKYVSYTGEYPCLCQGILTMELNGKIIVFPENCLSSGGEVSFTEEWDEIVTTGKWNISKFPVGFPDYLKQEAVDLVNANV